MMDKLSDFFRENSQYGGLIAIAFGVLVVLGAIRNWEWLFEGGTGRIYSISNFENKYGRKAARSLVAIIGLVLVVCGNIMYILALI